MPTETACLFAFLTPTANRHPSKLHGQIQDAEHLHSIFRYGELFIDNGDLAMTQCVDQSFDDRTVSDWERASLLTAVLAPEPTPPV